MNAINEFCRYFALGATKEKRIGIELEHFVIKHNGMPLEYSGGMECVLSDLARNFDCVFYEDGSILGMLDDKFSITLEPGAQLEVSICPLNTADDINAAFDSFYALVTPVLQKHGARLCTVPVLSEAQLAKAGLIPKKRYEYMDKYFQASGTMGRYMMRGTASAQVSLDYSCEEDFVRKFRAAYLLTPLFALLTASGSPGDEMYLKRFEIWDNVDKIRTGPPQDLFCESFGFASYAEQLMNTPAIFIPQNGGYVYTGDETIASLASRFGTDCGLLEHYLSMVFPDVRLKNYIEIRIADSTSSQLAVDYGCFAAALLYNAGIVHEILTRYHGIGINDIENAKNSVRRHGKNAEIYGRNAGAELEYWRRLSGIKIGGGHYDKK